MWEAWPWPTTKRSFTLEKRAQKEAERIQKIQAEIAAFEQKVAATTLEEKEPWRPPSAPRLHGGRDQSRGLLVLDVPDLVIEFGELTPLRPDQPAPTP